MGGGGYVVMLCLCVGSKIMGMISIDAGGQSIGQLLGKEEGKRGRKEE